MLGEEVCCFRLADAVKYDIPDLIEIYWRARRYDRPSVGQRGGVRWNTVWRSTGS